MGLSLGVENEKFSIYYYLPRFKHRASSDQTKYERNCHNLSFFQVDNKDMGLKFQKSIVTIIVFYAEDDSFEFNKRIHHVRQLMQFDVSSKCRYGVVFSPVRHLRQLIQTQDFFQFSYSIYNQYLCETEISITLYCFNSRLQYDYQF